MDQVAADHLGQAVKESKMNFRQLRSEAYEPGYRSALNEQMIEEGYAWSYDGGTKNKNFSELLEKRGLNKQIQSFKQGTKNAFQTKTTRGL